MRIVINSDPKLLNILRGVVRYRAQEMGFSEADAEALALAVNEAATNVMRHTYVNQHAARLSLEVLNFPDRMEFFLEDSGPKVRAEAIQPRPLEEVRPGGLGVHFIRRVMDVCAYDEEFGGGNRLKMTKYLPRKVSACDETAN